MGTSRVVSSREEPAALRQYLECTPRTTPGREISEARALWTEQSYWRRACKPHSMRSGSAVYRSSGTELTLTGLPEHVEDWGDV